MLPADKVGTWKQLKDMKVLKVLKVLKDMKVLKVLKVLKVPKQRYRTGRETHKFLLVIINRHVTSSDTTLR